MPQPLRIALILFAAAGFLGFIGFLFWRALRRSDEPTRLIVKWLVTFLLLGWLGYETMRAQGADRLWVLILVALPSAVVLIVLWGRSIGGLVARPFENMFMGGDDALVDTVALAKIIRIDDEIALYSHRLES